MTDETPPPAADDRRGAVAPIAIEEELQRSYLDYAMSVIVARAIPDVRDGLKPVQRRILIAMNDLGLAWNRGFRNAESAGKFLKWIDAQPRQKGAQQQRRPEEVGLDPGKERSARAMQHSGNPPGVDPTRNYQSEIRALIP